MFCSVECYNQAFKRFHNYECPVMGLMSKSGSVSIALRLLFISLAAFNSSVEKLQDFFIKSDAIDVTPFDFDLSAGENLKEYLKCLNSLCRSSKVFSIEPHIDILSHHPDLHASWKTHETFLRDLLQRHCQINDLYFHGIFSSSLKLVPFKDNSTVFTDYQQPIGSGWFPFCSLINHSCAPNVVRIYVEGKVVLVACRPIDKGSQLYDCYK